jgi:hypothetical protein
MNSIGSAVVLEDRSKGVEVVSKASRRRFTAEYKLKVLREAAACWKPGEVGALLLREGLYTSHLCMWRKQRGKGELFEKKRGPAPPIPVSLRFGWYLPEQRECYLRIGAEFFFSHSESDFSSLSPQ